MRKTTIILVVLLIASISWLGHTYWGTVEAEVPAGKFPMRLTCVDKDELSAEFCKQFAIALAGSEFVTLDYDLRNPHFHLVVLPSAGDGYLAVTAVSSFNFPPLGGLSLTAFIGNWLIYPEMCKPGPVGEIVNVMVGGSGSWFVGNTEKLYRLTRPQKPYLEVHK